MDFDSAADKVYAAAREDFVSVRDELAKQAKADGDRALADRIRGLRKPTVAAWLVNQVVREYPEELQELERLGDEFRHAHQQLAGNELRRLSRQRHDLIRRLTDLARTVGDQPVGDEAERQVGETFEAALADPDAARQVAAGRLAATLQGDLSSQWLTAAVAPARPAGEWRRKREPEQPRKQPAAKPPRPAEPGPDDKRRLDEARKKAKETARALDEAAQALAGAEQEADRAAEEVADLRGKLLEAGHAEREARKRATAAQRSYDTAERNATNAQRDVDRLERARSRSS